MKTKNIFSSLLLCSAVLLGAPTPVHAQQELTSETPVIIAPHNITINYKERTLCYNLSTRGNVGNISITADADWVSSFKGTGGEVYIHVDTNYDNEARTANITFASEDGTASQSFTLVQTRDESADDIPSDIDIKPSSATTNSYQGGTPISNTYDGDYSTIYHSNWGNTVSASNPATLTYNFTNVEQIDYINYIPRQDGSSNGHFGVVSVYYTLKGGTEQLFGTFDWGMTGGAKTIRFPEGLKNPTRIRFSVQSGSGNFASCAEMEFRRTNGLDASALAVFADDVMSELRSDVTSDEIDAIENSFIKSLAMKLYKGTYDKAYRVASYEVYSSPEYLSDKWNAPGKYYDHCEGVTGINITKGKHAIVVAGIPESVGSVTLRVVAWYAQELNSSGEGGGPSTYEFALNNGINTIDYKGDFDGLAYINYFMYGEPDRTTHPDIRVHFVNGQVNGYLSKDKTNNEMHELCKNAVNRCMDVKGNKVHSVWQAAGLYDYCKTSSNTAKGYLQYMNVLDSLIVWEHRLLGFEKYNTIPKNHTMAYVNYTYYMFQGYWGVSFMYNQERRVLNCQTLMYNDNDAIWGLSHEWGHQHQMFPYFCWGSLGEVSNNMNSYYNIMAMGYRVSDKIDSYWPSGRRQALQDDPYKNGTTIGSARRLAYNARSNFSYNTDFSQLGSLMADSLIYPATDDVKTQWTFGGTKYDITGKMRGISHSEMGGEALTPFVMLYLYASRNWRADFGPDLYEALRRTDRDGGSDIEKSDGVDKYELIAAAQNQNKNGAYAKLRAAYPSSVWVTRSYLTKSGINKNDNTVPFILNFIRKCSRLTGKNLVPYFERWGFLRTVALQIGDYGTYYHLLTPSMYYEFKADMEQLVADGVLETIDDATVEAISNSQDMFKVEFGKTPTIPNK